MKRAIFTTLAVAAIAAMSTAPAAAETSSKEVVSYQAPWTPRTTGVKYGEASDPYKFDDSNTMGLKSSYKETFDEAKKKNYKNSAKDFKVKSDEKNDSTPYLQSAIDKMAKAGGGVLYVAPGTYRLKNLQMRSNVHLEFDKEVIMRPYLSYDIVGKKSKTGLINFGGSSKSDLVENSSIRCAQKGERYSVIYDDYQSVAWVIFVNCLSVYNFSMADANIYDNRTVHCGFCFGAAKEFIKTSDGTKISSPTRGELRDCSIFHSHPGYGLTQTGSAKDVYFENLYSLGGVTLRHEIGGHSEFTGAFNLRSRNIRNENGYCALLIGPHTSANGTILSDGVWSKGSCYTVNAGKGLVKDGKYGSFASDSKIINVEGVFGRGEATMAQKELWTYNPNYYSDVKNSPADLHNGGKFAVGSSNGVVRNDSEKTYNITIENVRGKGFENKYIYMYISDFNLPENFNGFDTRNKLGLNKKLK